MNLPNHFDTKKNSNINKCNIKFFLDIWENIYVKHFIFFKV